MKTSIVTFLISGLLSACLWATTIVVVPIFEPLSMHDTDGDEAISDTGEALQACVMSRPMALTGAYPEVFVEAIRSPHKIPSNNENYTAQEANLLVLANIGISATKAENGLIIRLDVTNLTIPDDVDLTSRQILNLTIVAIRKTLHVYQAGQAKALLVSLIIDGTTEKNSSLKELEAQFSIDDDEDAH